MSIPQLEGGTLSLDLGYSDTGGVQLGLWGMELMNYTVSPNDDLILGYLNDKPGLARRRQHPPRLAPRAAR